MNNPEEAQAIIDKVKAESYDQLTALNRQLNQMAGQLNIQNSLVSQIAAIVAPGEANLTQEQLLDKLRGAFQMKTDDEESTNGNGADQESEA